MVHRTSRPSISCGVALLLFAGLAACGSKASGVADPGTLPDAAEADPGRPAEDAVPGADIRVADDPGTPSIDLPTRPFCGKSCARTCSAKAPCATGTCCDLGDAGKACLPVCPQPCDSAADCAGNTGTGQTSCCRVNLFNPQKQCAAAASCVTPCTGDADCAGMGARVACCTKAVNAVCTSQCPIERTCLTAAECGTGEVCQVVFDPFRVLRKPGICTASPAVPFAPACSTDGDCDVGGLPAGLCCGGLCAADCPGTCSADGDCNRDAGQKCCDPVRSADWTPERP